MKIVYFGSSDFGIPCLDALVASEHEPVGVFTQPGRAAGRGGKVRLTPVAVWAGENGVTCVEAENVNSAEMLEAVAGCKADLLVVIAFGQYVGTKVIGLHRYRAINVHGSLLPKYRGAAPINWPIINGDARTGITIITLAKEMDAGEMLAHASVPIGGDDSAETMHEKLSALSAPVLLETIDRIAGQTAVYTKQDESEVSFAPKLCKSDGFLDFAESAVSIHNKIRGVWPWPGAQCDFVSAKTSKTSRVTIAAACVVDDREDSEKDQDHGTLDENLHVICGTGKIEILKIKPAGKGLMDFKSFANGRSLQPGDRFKTVSENR